MNAANRQEVTFKEDWLKELGKPVDDPNAESTGPFRHAARAPARTRKYAVVQNGLSQTVC